MAEEVTEDTAVEETNGEATETTTETITETPTKTTKEAEDWRAVFKDEAVRKEAEKSTDPDHFGKRVLDLRKQLSGAIVKPGKDATEEQVAAYRKAMEVPDSADGYEFPSVEGENAEAMQAEHKAWAEAFHNLDIPAPAAKQLVNMATQIREQTAIAEVEADKAFAAESEAALRDAWKGDFDKNVKIANRAGEKVFGDDFDMARTIQMKDGRFLMDHPVMMKMLAEIGLEMGEGSLGVVPEGERDTLEEQAQEFRKKADEAQAEGNRKKANEYSEKEREIYARLNKTAA